MVESTVTERLLLTPVAVADLDELHALHADPRVWTHFPQGRHLDRATTERQVEEQVADWVRDGIGYWTARRRDDDAFVGIGGVRRRPHGLNVYYRIAPEQQGQGFALEIGEAALRAAAGHLPEVPVTAFLLEHNLASRRTVERLGLHQVWRGPDAGNADPTAVRLVYADRDLPGPALEAILGA